MNIDVDASLLEKLYELSDGELRRLEKEHSEALWCVAPDLAEAFARERAHREAAKLQARWDKAQAELRKVQELGRRLAEKYPRFVVFSDEPAEPDALPDTATVAEVMEQALEEFPRQHSAMDELRLASAAVSGQEVDLPASSEANAQPEPESVQTHKLTLAERMAKAGRSIAARKRSAA